MILYKYLPSRFERDFLDRGEVLFRNLTYFQKAEGDTARSDLHEGKHLDIPNNKVMIENFTTGQVLEVDAAAVRQVDSQKIFVFCLSEMFSKNLMVEFGADMCVRILDAEKFVKRCAKAIHGMLHLDPCGLLARPVSYYGNANNFDGDITDSSQLCFLKNESFRRQMEYRLAFGIGNSLSTRQNQMSIIMKHALRQELEAGVDICKPRKRTVRIGKMRDFCEIIRG